MKKNLFYMLLIKLCVASFVLNAEDFKTIKDIVEIAKQHTPERIGFAQTIALSLYEKTQQRSILDSNGKNPYGREFPLNPEMLVELMANAKGKKILEIAGARGQNSLLLGLAGADHVYYNDITPSEVDFFTHTVSQLNIQELQNRFTAIKGDGSTLAQHIPAHSLDIIITRNYFHFLKASQYEAFFHMIKTLLKPGGILAMTVNGKFGGFNDISDRFTSFKITSLMTPQNTMLAHFVDEFDENNQSIEYTNIPLVRFTKMGRIIVKDRIEKLPELFIEKLTTYMKDSKDIDGDIRLFTYVSSIFSPTNLSRILEKNGFVVTKAKKIGFDGHYKSDEQLNDPRGYPSVGVIANLNYTELPL